MRNVGKEFAPVTWAMDVKASVAINHDGLESSRLFGIFRHENKTGGEVGI